MLMFLPFLIDVLLPLSLVANVPLLEVSPILLFLLVLPLTQNVVGRLNWNEPVDGDGMPGGQNAAGCRVVDRELVRTVAIQVPEPLKVRIPCGYHKAQTLGITFAEQASQEFVELVEC